MSHWRCQNWMHRGRDSLWLEEGNNGAALDGWRKMGTAQDLVLVEPRVFPGLVAFAAFAVFGINGMVGVKMVVFECTIPYDYSGEVKCL